MSKTILSMLVAMLLCVASSAKADETISSSTLSDMGLSGMTVMSDSDALSVRGMGFRGCDRCGGRNVRPLSVAAGASYAHIGVDDGSAGSVNGYFAIGPHAASGANYSEAASEVTNIEILDVGGVVSSFTTTCITKVYAGGSSSAMSF